MPTFSRLHMQLSDAATGLRIAGEATDQHYREYIQLGSIGWEMDRAVAKGAGRTRGAVQPGEFTLSKWMDRASTAMLTKMRHGVRLDAVVILDSPEDSGFKLTVRLTNARITDYRVDIKDAEKSGEILEDWTLTYDRIVVEYMPTEHETLTTRQERAPGAESARAMQDAVLNAFKALNDARRIDVSTTLRKEYPRLFSN